MQLRGKKGAEVPVSVSSGTASGSGGRGRKRGRGGAVTTTSSSRGVGRRGRPQVVPVPGTSTSSGRGRGRARQTVATGGSGGRGRGRQAVALGVSTGRGRGRQAVAPGVSSSRGRGRQPVVARTSSFSAVGGATDGQQLVPVHGSGSSPPASTPAATPIPSTSTATVATGGMLALPAPPSAPECSPDFYQELVDNWEYTGCMKIEGDLGLRAFLDNLRDEFWHYVQQLAGKWLLVAVEPQEAPEDNSKCVLFKLCHCSTKRKKIIKETFATVRLVTRPAYPYTSYWLHIENPQIATVQGVSLRVLKMACESAFGTILMRRPTNYRPNGAQQVGGMCLNAPANVKLEPEGEERSLELFLSGTD